METKDIRNVVIIGSGPAGYMAGIYTARANLKPLILAGYVYGGQLMITTEVENFPGYPNGADGSKIMRDLHEQSERFGAEINPVDCKSIDTSIYPFCVKTSDGQEILTKSIIIATGAKSLWLNAKGEHALKGRGISTCATCDGAFFKDEEIVVVGGGDSAMEEAIFLTRFASVVTIINRSNSFKASKIMYDRAVSNPKIKIIKNSNVNEWKTDSNNELVEVICVNNETSEIFSIPCKGAFIAIGHKPSSDFLNNQIERDEHGYITLKNNTMTNIGGIFACGDVCDKRYKQAVTACASGCMAAMDCEKWLESKNNI